MPVCFVLGVFAVSFWALILLFAELFVDLWVLVVVVGIIPWCLGVGLILVSLDGFVLFWLVAQVVIADVLGV